MEVVGLRRGKLHILSTIQEPFPAIGGMRYYYTLCKRRISEEELRFRRQEGCDTEANCLRCVAKLRRIRAADKDAETRDLGR